MLDQQLSDERIVAGRLAASIVWLALPKRWVVVGDAEAKSGGQTLLRTKTAAVSVGEGKVRNNHIIFNIIINNIVLHSQIKHTVVVFQFSAVGGRVKGFDSPYRIKITT